MLVIESLVILKALPFVHKSKGGIYAQLTYIQLIRNSNFIEVFLIVFEEISPDFISALLSFWWMHQWKQKEKSKLSFSLYKSPSIFEVKYFYTNDNSINWI